VLVAEEVEVTEDIGKLGWLNVEGDDGRGQPIPRPSRPSQDDVGELDGVAEEGDDDGELDGVIVGSGQPIPSPKSPLH